MLRALQRTHQSSRLVKLRVIYGSRLVRRRYRAWVLYPFMFFKDKQDGVTDLLFRHELEHVYQVQREGWLKFYIKYLYYLMRDGYWLNPYEIEARLRASTPLTETERKYKDKNG